MNIKAGGHPEGVTLFPRFWQLKSGFSSAQGRIAWTIETSPGAPS
jgi:hypothetical protein